MMIERSADEYVKDANSDLEARPTAQAPELRTVLLVQSDDSLLHSLHQLLENDGYTVLSADSGDAALSLCQEYKGNLNYLVTDVAVGLINGVELAAAVATSHAYVAIVFTEPVPLPSHDPACEECVQATAHVLPRPF